MNRLRTLRLEKDETLEKIAKYLNVTVQTVSNYENEKRDMSPDTILKLAEYFDVSTDYLLGKSDVRNTNVVNIDDVNVAFYNGIKGLNDTNKAILKGIIEGLVAKQKEEDKKEKK